MRLPRAGRTQEQEPGFRAVRILAHVTPNRENHTGQRRPRLWISRRQNEVIHRGVVVQRRNSGALFYALFAPGIGTPAFLGARNSLALGDFPTRTATDGTRFHSVHAVHLTSPAAFPDSVHPATSSAERNNPKSPLRPFAPAPSA